MDYRELMWMVEPVEHHLAPATFDKEWTPTRGQNVFCDFYRSDFSIFFRHFAILFHKF